MHAYGLYVYKVSIRFIPVRYTPMRYTPVRYVPFYMMQVIWRSTTLGLWQMINRLFNPVHTWRRRMVPRYLPLP
jgi:hypothetical protein